MATFIALQHVLHSIADQLGAGLGGWVGASEGLQMLSSTARGRVGQQLMSTAQLGAGWITLQT